MAIFEVHFSGTTAQRQSYVRQEKGATLERPHWSRIQTLRVSVRCHVHPKGGPRDLM